MSLGHFGNLAVSSNKTCLILSNLLRLIAQQMNLGILAVHYERTRQNKAMNLKDVDGGFKISW